MKPSPLGRYGFFWLTLALFIFSFIGHWAFGWFAYVDEQTSFGHPVEVSDFVVQTARDTFENWQSEFLQLIWQVAGLAYLLHIGSPQSKEGDERKEEKLDRILELLDKDAKQTIAALDKKYSRK